MSQVLNVKNLTQRFGGLVALEHVDMCVNEGEIVGIIGLMEQANLRCLTVSPVSIIPLRGEWRCWERI